MGVEYAHYLLVRDPGWVGDFDVARRVHAVLARYHLLSDEPELFELEGGRKRKLSGRVTTLKTPPANLLVRYPHVDGQSVAAVMGPSYYDSVAEIDRYFYGISLVLGTDFRIGPCSESISVDVVRPPPRNGRGITPYPEGHCLWEFDDSCPADAATLPPETRVEARGELSPGFIGVWRAGLMLNCGKDLPRTDGNGFGFRVNAHFAADLEAAFGAPLVEVGRIH